MHHKCVSGGATVNKERYKKVPTHLWESFYLNHTKMWEAKGGASACQCPSTLVATSAAAIHQA
jgi:hypothetical protein